MFLRSVAVSAVDFLRLAREIFGFAPKILRPTHKSYATGRASESKWRFFAKLSTKNLKIKIQLCVRTIGRATATRGTTYIYRQSRPQELRMKLFRLTRGDGAPIFRQNARPRFSSLRHRISDCGSEVLFVRQLPRGFHRPALSIGEPSHYFSSSLPLVQ